MKAKLLFGTILGFGLITNMYAAKSGVFMGLNVGLDGHATQSNVGLNVGNSSVNAYSAKYAFDFFYGVRAGLQLYLIPKLGLRAMGVFDMGNYSDTANKYPFFRYGGNVDLLYQFGSNEMKQIGLFVGVGYEAIGGNFKKALDGQKGLPGRTSNTQGIFVNAGLQMVRNLHHQVDFTVKVPFYSYFDMNYRDANQELRSLYKNIFSLSLSYTYVF